MAGSTAGATAIDLAVERPVRPRVGRDGDGLAGADAAEAVGRDVRRDLDARDVRDLDDRLRRRAVDLLADADEALHDLSRDGRRQPRAVDLALGEADARLGLLDPRRGRGAGRLRVLDLLARGDAALEEALDARELELRGLERRPRLRQRGAGLARLVLQRQGVDLGHDLAGADRVALGHPHRDDAAGHERRELHVLVRRRGDGTAHHERLDEVALHHLRRRGLDRRHRLRGHLFFAAAARAAGGDERERAQRPPRARDAQPYSIGPPSTSSRSASAD